MLHKNKDDSKEEEHECLRWKHTIRSHHVKNAILYVFVCHVELNLTSHVAVTCLLLKNIYNTCLFGMFCKKIRLEQFSLFIREKIHLINQLMKARYCSLYSVCIVFSVTFIYQCLGYHSLAETHSNR